jgi:hypothetical protein
MPRQDWQSASLQLAHDQKAVMAVGQAAKGDSQIVQSLLALDRGRRRLSRRQRREPVRQLSV